MKHLLFLLLFAAGASHVKAQRDTADNYVNSFVFIPAISVNTVPDSTVYTNDNLKKNSPFILMFFSPDCEHCQKEIKELMAYKQELKDVQILMVSSAPYSDIKNFYETFGLTSMPNVRLGQDLNLKLARIYQVRTYPSMYVYDNRGTLAKAFVGNIGVQTIIDAVK